MAMRSPCAVRARDPPNLAAVDRDLAVLDPRLQPRARRVRNVAQMPAQHEVEAVDRHRRDRRRPHVSPTTQARASITRFAFPTERSTVPGSQTTMAAVTPM
jgi:hypothetical protein